MYILFYNYENREGQYDHDGEIADNEEELKNKINDYRKYLDNFEVNKIFKINNYQEIKEQDLK